MIKRSTRNIQRLKHYREHQRDQAASDMEIARKNIETAQNRKRDADTQLETELMHSRHMLGTPITPCDMETAKQMAIKFEQEVIASETQLKKANVEGETARSKLMKCHVKVNQIETLENQISARRKQADARAEQAFLDDLSTLKEVRQ